MILKLSLLLLVTTAVSQGSTSCKRYWKKVGCYKEGYPSPNRSTIVNLRDETNTLWDGVPFETDKWHNTMHDLACQCYDLAKARNHTYFGIQFFGECWTNNVHTGYNGGKSHNCINQDYEECNDSTEEECVGRAFTNYIYKVEEPEEKEICKSEWKKLGCHIQSTQPESTTTIVNLRDSSNKKWDETPFNQTWWGVALKQLACKCSKLAIENGHDYFGIQYFGECWTGDSYKMYSGGSSENCIDVKYESCNDKNDVVCVGRSQTNYIYGVKKPETSWNEWGEWSTCSAKCDGGQKTRERTCKVGKCVGKTNEEQSCNEDACVTHCKGKLEIGLIMDASSSVTWLNFQIMKRFLVNFTRNFNVSEDGVHFGLITFSHFPRLKFLLSDKRFWNNADLERELMSERYFKGKTRIDFALRLAEKKFFCEECQNRPNVPKVLIVITDGASDPNSEPLSEASKELKNRRVNIISIGIGHAIDAKQLVDIAKDKSHVYFIKDFKFLTDKMNSLHQLSCNANAFHGSG